MSLTAFQRYRRMKQVEEMKPENIEKQNRTINETIATEPVSESAKENTDSKTSNRRRRNLIEE